MNQTSRDITIALGCLGVAATCGSTLLSSTATAGAPTGWVSVDTDPQPGVGLDFTGELAALYVGAACGEGEPPALSDPDAIADHCAVLRPKLEAFRTETLAKAAPFFDRIRPDPLPEAAVYPFGGGDLLWALIVYPDALEYTTISLEHAGDPRRFTTASKEDLSTGFGLLQEAMGTQLKGQWNWTRNMEATQRAGFPEQLVYALGAMVIHDYEPMSLRYFELRLDGSIDYLDGEEIEALADHGAEQLRRWGAPDYSQAFSNAEIRFRHKDGGPVKVFRHIAENLSDYNLTTDPNNTRRDPSLLAHLSAKGPVGAMTRAASHLLWEPGFSHIRDYLAQNLVWMPSDSTGLPPPFAAEAGLVQDTYGTFSGVYEASDQGERNTYDDQFVALFADNPQHPLDFLFGYPDGDKQPHMVVTRPAE